MLARLPGRRPAGSSVSHQTVDRYGPGELLGIHRSLLASGPSRCSRNARLRPAGQLLRQTCGSPSPASFAGLLGRQWHAPTLCTPAYCGSRFRSICNPVIFEVFLAHPDNAGNVKWGCCRSKNAFPLFPLLSLPLNLAGTPPGGNGGWGAKVVPRIEPRSDIGKVSNFPNSVPSFRPPTVSRPELRVLDSGSSEYSFSLMLVPLLPTPGPGEASAQSRSWGSLPHWAELLSPLFSEPGAVTENTRRFSSLFSALGGGGTKKARLLPSSRKPPLYLWHSDPRAFPTPDPGSQAQPGTPRGSHLRAPCARPVAPAAVCAPSRGPRHIRGAVRDFSLPSPSSSGQLHLHPALPGGRRRQGATDFKPFPCRTAAAEASVVWS